MSLSNPAAAASVFESIRSTLMAEVDEAKLAHDIALHSWNNCSGESRGVATERGHAYERALETYQIAQERLAAHLASEPKAPSVASAPEIPETTEQANDRMHRETEDALCCLHATATLECEHLFEQASEIRLTLSANRDDLSEDQFAEQARQLYRFSARIRYLENLIGDLPSGDEEGEY